MANFDSDFMKGFALGKQLRPQVLAGLGQESWETLFEGTVETVANDTSNGCKSNTTFPVPSALWVNAGDAVRITVNGVSKTLTAIKASSGGYTAGNSWLYGNEGTDINEDTGYDYLLYQTLILGFVNTSFYSRSPGTYSVKIERMVST